MILHALSRPVISILPCVTSCVKSVFVCLPVLSVCPSDVWRRRARSHNFVLNFPLLLPKVPANEEMCRTNLTTHIPNFMRRTPSVPKLMLYSTLLLDNGFWGPLCKECITVVLELFVVEVILTGDLIRLTDFRTTIPGDLGLWEN